MIAAGLLYVAVLFALGFLLGVIRTLFVEPRLGPAAAVALEAVPMLAAMAVAAPWAARLGDVPSSPAARLGMGLVALLCLVLLETLFAAVLRGRAPDFWLERPHTPEGRIGLGLMLAFALMPLLRRRA
jgi:hypothetical protein